MERQAEDNREELAATLANLYLTVLLVVVPLYTGGGYWKIGDSKYLIYRNVSLCVMAAGLLLLLLWVLGCFRERKLKMRGSRAGLSQVDAAMLVYSVCVLLSLWNSSYRHTAWTGYEEWYMGALSQLMFVGGFFLISRCYRGAIYPVRLGEAALLVVAAIGLLQRLGVNTLGLLSGYDSWDWEYSHMLSTIGNINWFCGYMSVVLGLCITGFLYADRKKNPGRFFGLGILSLLSLLLLCVQGSDSGLLLVAACMIMISLYGIRRGEWFRKGILLALGMSIGLPILNRVMMFLNGKASMPADGDLCKLVLGFPWWILSLPLLVLYLILGKLPEESRRKSSIVCTLLGVLTAVAGSVYLIASQGEMSWGSGRDRLWQLALMGFERADWGQKLLGAGPDCFAEYIYQVLPVTEMIQSSGRWADAIYANAHNEWLNSLINLGVLGTAAYAGIFVTAWRRYQGLFLGRLLLVLYGVHSLVSFQQVLNAPLFFAVLGLCEYRVRGAGGTVTRYSKFTLSKKEKFDRGIEDGLQSS